MVLEYLTLEEFQAREEQLWNDCKHLFDDKTIKYAEPIERNGKYYMQILDKVLPFLTDLELNSLTELPVTIEEEIILFP